jgi:acyl-CoA thioesterase
MQASPQRFHEFIGIESGERADGVAVSEIEIQPQHMNPHGVVHGGVLYSMADNGMGAALYTVMRPDELCATIEIKIVYLAPVREGRVRCESKVLNRGKRVATLESEITVGGKLVAKALGTFALFERPPGAGG